MSRARSWVMVLMMAAAAAPVAAQSEDAGQPQDSRSARLEAERDRKAAEIVPPHARANMRTI